MIIRLGKVGGYTPKKEDDDDDDMKMMPDELIQLLIEHPEITLEAVEDGMEHELEHTECPCVRARITMDHLLEDNQYYEKLEKMEGEEEDADEKDD
jgi:hypothetical protein